MDCTRTTGCLEIRIFETGQQTSSLSSQLVNPTASFYTSLHCKPHMKRETSSKLSCIFCKGNHTAINCDVHKDAQSCVEIIKQQQLCYNSLAHHCVSQCNSTNCCHKCGNKYHTSICNDSTNKTSSDTSHTNPSLTTLAPCQLAKNTTCLLKTAIATIVGSDLQTEANV